MVYRTAFFFPYVASLGKAGWAQVEHAVTQPEFGPVNEFLKFNGTGQSAQVERIH